jgi:hypothetical protein
MEPTEKGCVQRSETHESTASTYKAQGGGTVQTKDEKEHVEASPQRKQQQRQQRRIGDDCTGYQYKGDVRVE